VHFHDIDNFYHEWDIDKLPWSSISSLAANEEHPEELDQHLIDVLQQGPLNEIGDNKPQARAAALAFLYMYAKLAGSHRYCVVVCAPNFVLISPFLVLLGHRSIFLPDLPSQ